MNPEREINFKELLAQSENTVVFSTDCEGNLQSSNRGYGRILNYSEKNLCACFINPVFEDLKKSDQQNVFRGIVTLKKDPSSNLSFNARVFKTPQGLLFIGETDVLETAILYEQMSGLSASVSKAHRELIKKETLLRDAYNQLEKKTEELNRAKEEAEEANRAKSDFLSAMSHEIRTPLNGVIGFTELIAKTKLSPIQKQYIENAITSAKTLLEIINDILDFSKIEAGRLELDEIETNIIQLVEETADIVKYSAASKKIELLLNIDTSVPRVTVVDPVRIKQILVNLLSNAIKFTEKKGEVELSLSAQWVSEKQDDVLFTFSVRDTGIGISAEEQKKLFKPFSQADISITRKYGGTGLGLTISKNLARKMGSQIILASEKNRGSVFSFTIKRPALKNQRNVSQKLPNIARVLIVDDNAGNRTILQHRFKEWGIESVTAESGYEALEVIKNSLAFDIAIIDYDMPGLNGIETITEIRKIRNSPSERQPVILLYSSCDDNLLHEECVDLGIALKLVKPVRTEEMIGYLKKIANHQIEAGSDDPLNAGMDAEYISSERVTILVVDDVPLNNTLIKTVISKILVQSKVLEAKNGQEAVEMYTEHKPHLVFMDIQMPGMNGFEAAKEIFKIADQADAPTKIVALSASNEKTEKQNCFDCGMSDYLEKPLDSGKLSAVLEKYL